MHLLRILLGLIVVLAFALALAGCGGGGGGGTDQPNTNLPAPSVNLAQKYVAYDQHPDVLFVTADFVSLADRSRVKHIITDVPFFFDFNSGKWYMSYADDSHPGFTNSKLGDYDAIGDYNMTVYATVSGSASRVRVGGPYQVKLNIPRSSTEDDVPTTPPPPPWSN